MKKNGFAAIELVIASGIFSFFIISELGASLIANNICNSSIVVHDLQRDAAFIVRQIAARDTGENDFVGLRSAAELITDAAHPTDLVFMSGTPRNERRYRAAGNSIFYISPTIQGGSRTIYTAAGGVTIRFGYVALTAKKVMLDLVLSQPFSGRTISGSARLVVTLKNVP